MRDDPGEHADRMRELFPATPDKPLREMVSDLQSAQDTTNMLLSRAAEDLDRIELSIRQMSKAAEQTATGVSIVATVAVGFTVMYLLKSCT